MVEIKNITEAEALKLAENIVKQSDIKKQTTVMDELKTYFEQKEKKHKKEEEEKYKLISGDIDGFSYKNNPTYILFLTYYEKYLLNKKNHQEKIEIEREKNGIKKKKIIKQIQEILKNSLGDINNKIYNQFLTLKDEWKEVRKANYKEDKILQDTYQKLVTDFINKRRASVDLFQLNVKIEKKRKNEICEKIEKLAEKTYSHTLFETIVQLQEEFKKIKLPLYCKAEEDILWNRYRKACDIIYEKKKEISQEYKKLLEKNWEEKKEIITKINEIVVLKIENTKEWIKKTEEIKKHILNWKNIGPIPRKEKKEVIDQFKTSCNLFFKNRNEFFEKKNGEKDKLLKEKFSLCQQIEDINKKEEKEWAKDKTHILHIQKEWRKIEFIADKEIASIHKRYRKACHIFFSDMQAYFDENKKKGEEAFKKKKDICNQLLQGKETEIEKIKQLIEELLNLKTENDASQRNIIQKLWENIEKVFESIEETQNTKEEKDKILTQLTIAHPNLIYEIEKQLKTISYQKKKLINEVYKIENNMGFFIQSKSSEQILMNFKRKVEKIKQEIKAIEKKERNLLKMKNKTKQVKNSNS